MTAELITVFGASGFVGRYVVRALAKAGYRVRAAVRRPGPAIFLRPMGVVGQIQIVQANVRVRPTIERALEDAWGVVDLVGVMHQSGAQRFMSLNAQAPAVIAELAARHGVKAMVHVSALGALTDSPSLYLRTKAMGEEGVRAAFPEAAILRPALVFGPEDEFFNRFASIARLSPVLPLFGGGKTKFQPVFAGDVGSAVLAAISNPKFYGKTFELGGPRVYTFRELMEEMLRVTERKRLLIELPWAAAQLAAGLGMLMPGFLMKPLLTFDQIKMLQEDNVIAPGSTAGTLDDLGITSPRSLEAELPAYLWRFRKSGQFEVSGYA
ncbi:MAG: complex I NDUFA9 subunit family protein [Alphaproteobacteria bacterium]